MSSGRMTVQGMMPDIFLPGPANPRTAPARTASLVAHWLSERAELCVGISGKVPGGIERKTHKMMRLDLEAARTKWIEAGKSAGEREARQKSDFLAYCDSNGRFADFHSNRHSFITSLERAALSPKMAQTLARHSDVRLTLGVYTHVGSSRSSRGDSLAAGSAGDERRPWERRRRTANQRDQTAARRCFDATNRKYRGADSGAERCQYWCRTACIADVTGGTGLHWRGAKKAPRGKKRLAPRL